MLNQNHSPQGLHTRLCFSVDASLHLRVKPVLDDYFLFKKPIRGKRKLGGTHAFFIRQIFTLLYLHLEHLRNNDPRAYIQTLQKSEYPLDTNNIQLQKLTYICPRSVWDYIEDFGMVHETGKPPIITRKITHGTQANYTLYISQHYLLQSWQSDPSANHTTDTKNAKDSTNPVFFDPTMQSLPLSNTYKDITLYYHSAQHENGKDERNKQNDSPNIGAGAGANFWAQVAQILPQFFDADLHPTTQRDTITAHLVMLWEQASTFLELTQISDITRSAILQSMLTEYDTLVAMLRSARYTLQEQLRQKWYEAAIANKMLPHEAKAKAEAQVQAFWQSAKCPQRLKNLYETSFLICADALRLKKQFLSNNTHKYENSHNYFVKEVQNGRGYKRSLKIAIKRHNLFIEYETSDKMFLAQIKAENRVKTAIIRVANKYKTLIKFPAHKRTEQILAFLNAEQSKMYGFVSETFAKLHDTHGKDKCNAEVEKFVNQFRESVPHLTTIKTIK